MIKLSELLSKEAPISSKLRIHMSKEPITQLRNKEASFGSPMSKPTGFWYGFGRDWIDFVCNSHEFKVSKCGDYIYLVKVVNPPKILKISTKEQIKDFTQKYGVEMGTKGYIRWDEVEKQWAGIEINPFLGKLYRDGGEYSWYGFWDIASGCVWDVSTIELKQIYPKV